MQVFMTKSKSMLVFIFTFSKILVVIFPISFGEIISKIDEPIVKKIARNKGPL